MREWIREHISLAVWLIAYLIFMFGLIASTSAHAADLPRDPQSAHMIADGIAFPRLVAAVNEYDLHHPKDQDQPFDHIHLVNAKQPKQHEEDRARFKAVEKAYAEWRAAMKRAGY